MSACVSWIFSRSEAALIRSDQRFNEWLQSFTQYACKIITCDREKAYTTIAGVYRRISLSLDRTENTEVPIVGHTFLWPYFVNKLVHAYYQLITSGLKEFSGEGIRTCRFIVFNQHNDDFDLLIVRRRNLFDVIINRVRNNICKGGIGVVIAL